MRASISFFEIGAFPILVFTFNEWPAHIHWYLFYETNKCEAYQNLRIHKIWRRLRDGGATSNVEGGGALTKKGTSLEKKGIFKGKSQSESIPFFLDPFGIYPYIVITLSGMISIFVSPNTSYKILLKHHTLQLGVMVWNVICERAKRENKNVKDLWGRSAKNYIL